MIGGEPMPDRCELAETIRVPMVAVPVQMLRCCRGAVLSCRDWCETPELRSYFESLLSDVDDALAAH